MKQCLPHKRRDTTSLLTRIVRPSRRIEESLSENTILELNDIFLTRGIHAMTAYSVEEGRNLIYAVLASLKCFHTIACVTLATLPLEPSIYACAAVASVNIEEFFVERPYFDFLWIESTQTLEQAPWFADFKTCLLDQHLDQEMPILVVSYDHD